MTTHVPGLRRQLACLLYEGLVIFAILLIGFLMPQIVLSGFGIALGGKGLWIHVFLLLMAYFSWCWTHGGQTLPMKTWKLRVISKDGHSLRPAQAILRYFAAWLSTLLLGAGFLWVLFDPEKRYLHDRIADTRIIQVTDT